MARKTFWLDDIVSLTLVPAMQNQTNLTSSLSVADRRGITLVRMIYNLKLIPVDHVDTDTVQQVFMGTGLIESDAVSAGTLPDPNIEGDAPGRGWVVRDFSQYRSPAGTSGNLILGSLKGDIRSMRTIYQTEELLMIFITESIAGTAQSARLNGIVRCLWKLP